MATVFNFFIVPTDENVVQLSHAEIRQVLAENAALLAACAELRVAVSVALNDPTQPSAVEPPTSFLAARADAERRLGVRLVKFFHN